MVQYNFNKIYVGETKIRIWFAIDIDSYSIFQKNLFAGRFLRKYDNILAKLGSKPSGRGWNKLPTNHVWKNADRIYTVVV